VESLTEWCFQEDENEPDDAALTDNSKDEDFVLVRESSKDLNPGRTHVLRVLVLAALRLEETGAYIFVYGVTFNKLALVQTCGREETMLLARNATIQNWIGRERC